MNRRRLAISTFVLTLAVWLPMSWPLPRLLNDAVPFAAIKRESAVSNVVPMTPGDHLQFAYHLWLFSDYLSGRTPFFCDLYEFNTGDDAARRHVEPNYVPYSVVFSVFYWLGGDALAWNLTGLLALWLACAATWLLARRYTGSDLVACIAALVAILSPFQWAQLFGGSPAGLGMTFVPLLLLGLDRAVRDENIAGGWLAGAGLLFAATTDMHVFFFSALVTPCWCVVAFTQRASFNWRKAGAYLRIAWALAPLVLLAMVAGLVALSGKKGIERSHASEGRRISEVALFSPKADGLWCWHPTEGASHQIYIGSLVAVLCAAGLIALLVLAGRQRDRKSGQRLALMILLALGATGIVLLALGPFSPFDGRVFTAARRFIPSYTSIRQPAKIFVLMPAVLALATALSLGALRALLSRRAAALLTVVLAVGFFSEYYAQTQLRISRLDRGNEAYAAAVADAESRHRVPRVVVLPLWPGDSHYTSVYQYFASRYRLRMVNGYLPFVPAAYVTNIFERFSSLNQGSATDDQLDDLLARGIDHVILHEDLFPEKVSPFPVGATLRGLLNHPRLALLRQDGPVWAFRILPLSEERAPVARDWTYLLPTRQFEAERQHVHGATKREDGTASQGALITLTPDSDIRSTPLTTASHPGLRWSLRVRGKGTIVCDRLVAATSVGSIDVTVDSTDWTWTDVPIGAFDGARSLEFVLLPREGEVDVDLAMLLAGAWRELQPGESMDIPAPCFFHAGSTDLPSESVQFLRKRDRSGLVFYGPKLPLAPGHYGLSVVIDTDAADGTPLGRWITSCPEGNEIARTVVTAGRPTRQDVEVPSNLPFLCVFDYSGAADLRIRSVRITRVD